MPATCRLCLLFKAVYVLAVRAVLNLFFPQRDILSRFGRCAIHGYACHRPSTARSDPLCCLLDLRMSLLFCAGIVCVCTVWERGRFARNTLFDKYSCSSKHDVALVIAIAVMDCSYRNSAI